MVPASCPVSGRQHRPHQHEACAAEDHGTTRPRFVELSDLARRRFWTIADLRNAGPPTSATLVADLPYRPKARDAIFANTGAATLPPAPVTPSTPTSTTNRGASAGTTPTKLA